MSGMAKSGDAFDFKEYGDTCRGVIARVKEPFMVVNQFNGNEEQKMVITVTQPDGTEAAIWLRTDPPNNIARAVTKAVEPHGYEIEDGARIAVQYVGEEDIGKGNPMKVFTCLYEPPVKGVTLEVVPEPVAVVETPAPVAPAEDLLDF